MFYDCGIITPTGTIHHRRSWPMLEHLGGRVWCSYTKRGKKHLVSFHGFWYSGALETTEENKARKVSYSVRCL